MLIFLVFAMVLDKLGLTPLVLALFPEEPGKPKTTEKSRGPSLWAGF